MLSFSKSLGRNNKLNNQNFRMEESDRNLEINSRPVFLYPENSNKRYHFLLSILSSINFKNEIKEVL